MDSQRPDYGHAHRKERARWQAIIDNQGFTCTRCGHWRPPGTPFDLDHDDHDLTRWLGPACRRCNRGAGGRKARARARLKLIRTRNW